jgi:hypothetical protein
MSDFTDIAAPAQRFATPFAHLRHGHRNVYAKLMPLKKGIVELREKGPTAQPCPRASRSDRRNRQHRNDRAVSRGDELQFNVSTTTSTIRSSTHSCSEHNPSATYRRFASDRRDRHQSASAASLPTTTKRSKP